MTDWTKLETKHQAMLEYYQGPFDKTFGNDMQDAPLAQDAPCVPMETPQRAPGGIEVERAIN